jgi:hypothetical protein
LPGQDVGADRPAGTEQLPIGGHDRGALTAADSGGDRSQQFRIPAGTDPWTGGAGNSASPPECPRASLSSLTPHPRYCLARRIRHPGSQTPAQRSAHPAGAVRRPPTNSSVRMSAPDPARPDQGDVSQRQSAPPGWAVSDASTWVQAQASDIKQISPVTGEGSCPQNGCTVTDRKSTAESSGTENHSGEIHCDNGAVINQRTP